MEKGVKNLLKYFLPNEYVKSIIHIDADELQKRGIKAVITDLDNTLVAWNRSEASPELLGWFQRLKEKGILVTVISNNHLQRVKSFVEPLGVPFVCSAKKPMSKGFKRALKTMGVKPDETVVIGDQLLTDVFGGNRLGFYTILVVPLSSTDGFVTRFNRKMERMLLSKMRRKGMIYWEDEQ